MKSEIYGQNCLKFALDFENGCGAGYSTEPVFQGANTPDMFLFQNNEWWFHFGCDENFPLANFASIQYYCGGFPGPIPPSIAVTGGNHYLGLLGDPFKAEAIARALQANNRVFGLCSYQLDYAARGLSNNCQNPTLTFHLSNALAAPGNTNWYINGNWNNAIGGASPILDVNWTNHTTAINTTSTGTYNFFIARNGRNEDENITTYALIDNLVLNGVELGIQQVPSTTAPQFGEIVTFDVTISNPTPLTFNSIQVDLELGQFLQMISPGWSLTNVPPGSQSTFFNRIISIPPGNTTFSYQARNVGKINCPIAIRSCITVNMADECIRRESCVDLNSAPGLVMITGNRNISEFFPAFGSTTIANGTAIYLNGALTINENFTFSGCDIACSAGSVIAVPDGKVFNNMSTSYHGCDQLWTGIRVEKASLGFNSVNVMDAEYAVDASSKSKLTIVNSQFIDNFTGIRIQPTSNSTGLPSKNGPFAIGGNSFRGINPLLPATNPLLAQLGPLFVPYVGIEVRDVQGVNINSIGAGLAWNLFDRMRNGIISVGSSINVDRAGFNNISLFNGNSNLTIRGNAIYCNNSTLTCGTDTKNAILNFTNCNNAVNCDKSNLGFYGGTMDQCVVGINAVKPDGKYTNISNTVMTNVKRRGIIIDVNSASNLSSLVYNVYVYFNSSVNSLLGLVGISTTGKPSGRFQIVQNKIFFLGSAINQIGIRAINAGTFDYIDNFVNASTGATGINISGSAGNFQCNKISGSSQDPLFNNTHIGINANTLLGECTLNCNKVTNISVGMRFQGLSSLTDRIEYNTFANNFVGLWYRNNNTITGTQYLTTNIWKTNPVSGGASCRHDGTDFFAIQQSEFIVHDVDEFNPILVLSNGVKWFDPIIPPNTPMECVNCDLTTTVNNNITITPLDSALVDGDFQDPIFFPNADYIYTKRLLLRALIEPQLVSTSNMVGTFFNNRINTAAGKIAQIQKLGIVAADPDTARLKRISIISNIEARLLYRIYELDSLIVEANPANQVFLNLQRDMQFDSLLILQTEKQVHINVIQVKKDSINQLAMNVVNSIQPSNAWGHNDKYCYMLLATGQAYQLTPATRDSLLIIASSCWGTAGDAVFIARALLDTINSNWDDCEPILPRSMDKQNSLTNKLEIYPNPANTNIRLAMEYVGVVDVRVYNQLGVLVYSKTIDSTDAIDISTWSNGLYYVQAEESGNAEIQFTRFVKQ